MGLAVPTPGRGRRRDRRGMAMLEMVWVLPVLLLVLFAIAQFGLMFQRWMTLSNAVREGARLLVVYRPDCSNLENEVIQRVKQYAEVGGIDPDQLLVEVEGECDPSGSRAEVKASYSFVVRVPFGTGLFTDIVPLEYETWMRKE